MRFTVKKTIAIVVLAFIMVMSVCASIAVNITKASASSISTNTLFTTTGVTLTNEYQPALSTQKGTLVSPTREGAFVKINRAMVGITNLEFCIVDTVSEKIIVISFDGTMDGFDVEFAKEGDNFVATVIEFGMIKGAATVTDPMDIVLSFDANKKEVELNGVKISDVESLLPTYEVFCAFNSISSGNNDLVFFKINGHGLDKATVSNASGPNIFADLSVKGLVNSFYTLPTPYGCDIIDGAINEFEVEVQFGSNTLVAKSQYTQALGFTPVTAGRYNIIYYAKDQDLNEGSQEYTLTVLSTASYTSTVFKFNSMIEDITLGENSSMIIPKCSVSNSSASIYSYDGLLTVKKDGVVLSNYNGVAVGVSDKFDFTDTGIYEFIYKASNKNLVGEKEFTVTVVNDMPSINIPNFKASYLTNDKIELPAATMTLNGVTIEAQSVINYPVSKKAIVTDYASLCENGLYTIEYRATFSGKMYVYNRNITVLQPAYETKEGTAVYTTSPMEQDVSGVLVKLALGDTFTLNEVIDISDKKPGQAVLAIDIIPSKYNITDFMQLNVKFTDIYDEDNYVTISCRRNRDEETEQRMSYVKAGYKDQAQVGLESGITPYYEPSIWGEYISCSFTGLSFNTFFVSFDYANRVIYANDKKIVELNSPLYFDDLWNGFTTGECYVSISVQELRAMEATFMVTKVGDIDLTNSVINDREAPVISIDTDYSLNQLPSAVVGRPYKVFDASAYDLIAGDVEVISSVYYAYTSSSKGEINVVDGEFTPFIKGRYTIEYKAIDDNGNVSIKTVNVYAYDSLEDMTLTILDAPSESWLVGREVQVADYTVYNANGNATVDIIAKNKASNREYTIKDYKFIPYESGDFTIIYTATDYIERTKEKTYDITVGNDGRAVFKEEADLPFVFIQGESYTLPILKAYYYTVDGENEVEVKTYVQDANGNNEISGEYSPSVSSSGNTVTITYKATTDSGDTEKQYNVPVKIIKNNKEYDMTQYFIGNVNVSADENNVIITTSSDQVVKFIKPLIVNNFNFDFNVNTLKNGFNVLDVYLTDMYDANVRVKFSYIRAANGVAYMSLNDGVAAASVSSFIDSAKSKFVVSYNDVKFKLSDELGNGLRITSTIYGEEFNGFPSGRVYFEFGFRGVTSESQIKINSINSQKFTSSKIDNVRPQVFIDGALGGGYPIGSTYAIPLAYALDVLDTTVRFNMTIMTPSGQNATDTNGVTIKDVDPSVARSLILSETGIYTFTYSARDTSNRLYKFSVIITVPDLVSPTITINGSVPTTATVGGTKVLPAATAYKNGAVLMKYNDVTYQDEPVKVVVFVICPNTRRERATRNEDNGKYSYKFTQKGVHTVVYVVYDDYGNSAEQRFTVTVS